MQSFIRKVKSLPILSAKDIKPKEAQLTNAELLHQIDLLDDLIDTMIEEAQK